MTDIREQRAELEEAIATNEGFLTHMCHADIAWTVHAANKAKGFWPLDGEPERDFGQVIALIHGEVDEAYEASWTNGQDDKLPQYKAVDVEIVDTIIRLYDACGAYVTADFDEIMNHVYGMTVHGFLDGVEYGSLNDKLMVLHHLISKALDAHRKSVQTEFEVWDDLGSSYIIQCPQYHLDLAAALTATIEVCRLLGIDYMPIMDAKFAFNKTRPVKHGAKY